MSSHEYGDWKSSIAIAYAKGARTFERHIDIDTDGVEVSPYCSFAGTDRHLVQGVEQGQGDVRRAGKQQADSDAPRSSISNALVRGVYAARDLAAGHRVTDDDFHLAIPLLKGQLSCRELIAGEQLARPLRQGEPLTVDALDDPYSRNPSLQRFIADRGLDPE